MQKAFKTKNTHVINFQIIKQKQYVISRDNLRTLQS